MNKFILSEKFKNILSKMKDNKIANSLLNVNVEFDIQHNFLDSTDLKDTISFTPQRKVIEAIGNIPILSEIHSCGRHLSLSSHRNINMFNMLGFDPECGNSFEAGSGTIGEIINEAVSSSGKTYVLFKEARSGRLSVVNKEAIRDYKDHNLESIWTTSRNNIKIGRLVRSFLPAINKDIVDSEIEEFVNLYKSTYDFLGDALSRFTIVSGEIIKHWYKADNYFGGGDGGGGILNNSCMAHSDSNFFDIYSKNSAVKMLLFYDEDGTFKDGVYESNKIKGRAILWDCEIDGVKSTYMDRIYTRYDSDVELFKQYGVKNGFWFKDSQTMDQNEYISNDCITKKRAHITVKLDHADTDRLPYMDTLSWIDINTSIATNRSDLVDFDNEIRNARTTSGDWEGREEDEYDYCDDGDDDY